MNDWLRTWEWGWVRIVEDRETVFFKYLRDDDLGEWSYYWTGEEIVAVHNWEED